MFIVFEESLLLDEVSPNPLAFVQTLSKAEGDSLPYFSAEIGKLTLVYLTTFESSPGMVVSILNLNFQVPEIPLQKLMLRGV